MRENAPFGLTKGGIFMLGRCRCTLIQFYWGLYRGYSPNATSPKTNQPQRGDISVAPTGSEQ
jgi:hypothetical protein